MASRVPALIIFQTLFLAWAMCGCVAHVRAEGLTKDDARVTAMATKQTSVMQSRRQLSEPAKRENLGVCLVGCPLPLLPTCCFGVCVNTQIDLLHCGACGNVCPHGTVCCRGTCVNLLTDPNNCGLCGRRCSVNRCFLGMCGYGLGRI